MKQRGFTLIELAVALTVMALLLMLGAPGYGRWVQNQRVRAAAESIQSGLQLAKAEAIKRNTAVRFSLVDKLSSGCSLVATSSDVSDWNWIVSTVDPITNSCPDPGESSGVIQSRAGAEGSGASTITVKTTLSTVSFDGLARGALDATYEVSAGGTGQCGTDSSSIRCLNIIVTAPGGEVRMCDPAVTSSSDPRAC